MQAEGASAPAGTGAARAGAAVAVRTAGGSAWLALAYLVVALVLAAPVVGVEVSLGVDTLNHLARIHVRAHLADDPDLARLFALRDGLVPYMGLDWMLTPLARVMPTLDAGRLGTVLLVWGLMGAAAVLQRAVTGRVGAGPLLVGLVGWNALVAWGFLNYVLGVVCALLGLAAWHALRERGWLLRLAVFTAVATGMYCVHLLGLAVYGAMLGAYEAFGRPRAWRTPVWEWLLLAAQFVPAGVLWIGLAAPPPSADNALRWLAGVKRLVLPSPFLFAGAGGGLDFGFLVAPACALLLTGLTLAGMLRWDRRLAAPAAALMLLGLLAPTRAFGVTLVDLRFPAVAACLAAAAVQLDPRVARARAPLGLALAAGTLLQAGSVRAVMRACDGQYAELRAALPAVPRGAVLTAVLEDEPARGGECSDLPIYNNMPLLITLERSGYNPVFFAQATGVGVRGGLPTDQKPTPADAVTRSMLPQGGYLLWMHLGHRRLVPAGLTLLRSGSFFDLYGIS